MCSLSVIFVAGFSHPASPSREVPALVGQPRTVNTPTGVVDIAPIKVFTSGALVEVRAELTATPSGLLDRPDQVITPSPGHPDYALTLRTHPAEPGISPTRPDGAAAVTRTHHWNLAFWVPRAAWADVTPHLVWPIARLDVPLQFNRVELSRAAMVVRSKE